MCDVDEDGEPQEVHVDCLRSHKQRQQLEQKPQHAVSPHHISVMGCHIYNLCYVATGLPPESLLLFLLNQKSFGIVHHQFSSGGGGERKT